MIIYLIDVDGELKPFVAPQHRKDGEMVETTTEERMPAEATDEAFYLDAVEGIFYDKIEQMIELDRSIRRLEKLINESHKE